jgi:hypothetical protein
MYCGFKRVIALGMTRGEYNIYRGWELPDDESHLVNEAGYLVEYVDGGAANHPSHAGYISWSPVDVFNTAYKASGKMSFGMAIEAAKQGFKVSRTGWNGKDLFAYIVPANKYPAQTGAVAGIFPDDMIPYGAYWALCSPSGVNTWTPSGSDSLANDWVISE